MDFFSKEIVVVKAWSITSIALIILSSFVYEGDETKFNFELQSIPVTAGYLALCFGILRYFAGDSRKSQKSPYNVIPIGIWGYIWRFLTAFILTFQISLLATAFLQTVTPFTPALLMIAIGLFLYPLFCILFFCEDRKRKIMQILSIFRGY